uniref:Insulin-like domain-containing protein n=1 Tax=Octopus bimaculoides TaxID=37653 RepID=A0A0L8IEJ1_OCTBM|eukprot:XP_014772597.1 PREDICTED: molluscan insulin-related peptide 3-like [Octopus bimaculoides]
MEKIIKMFTWNIVFLLFVTTLSRYTVKAGLEHRCNDETISRTSVSSSYCAAKMPNFLRLVCNREEYGKMDEILFYTTRCPKPKRSKLNGVVISKKKAKSHLTRKSNFWCGIVCECCHHTCSLDELLAYC